MASSFSVTVKEDFSLAYVSFGIPAAGETSPSYEDVEEAFRSAGVRVPLEAANIRAAIESGFYNQNITGARTKQPVDGTNGKIDFKFPAKVEIAPTKVDGSVDVVDYKNLGFVRNIRADTLIAEIHFETTGEAGEDVRGTKILQTPGKPVKVTVGKGTKLSPDGTKIYSAVDGNLRWSKDHFDIEEILTLPGDVDASTGNIDFLGNILIKGNVLENFSVTSEKNIQINGSVNNCTITAKGDCDIKLGAVNASLDVQKNLTIGFCEQAKIKCGGNVTSNSFVACEIFCGGELQALAGKGVIVGGKITCISGIQVKQLGSENYTKTRITVGNAAVLAEEKLNIEGQITTIQEKVKQLVKVENLLNTQRRQGSLPPERESMLHSATRDKLRSYGEIKRLQKKIAEIDLLIKQNQDLSIVVKGTAYPGVRVRIGSEKVTLETTYVRTKIYVDASGLISFKPII